jgi:hypothetical protein
MTGPEVLALCRVLRKARFDVGYTTDEAAVQSRLIELARAGDERIDVLRVGRFEGYDNDDNDAPVYGEGRVRCEINWTDYGAMGDGPAVTVNYEFEVDE